jgi:hypothetical protein
MTVQAPLLPLRDPAIAVTVDHGPCLSVVVQHP